MIHTNPLLRRVRAINRAGRAALCGYFLAGYDSPRRFYSAVRSAPALDVIEYGIATEEPHLDGPVIARAHRHVASELGVHAEAALALLGGLRDVPQPSFVMTYACEGRALEGFLRLCMLNGVSGVLAPDIAREDAARVALIASSLGLAYVGFAHVGMGDDELGPLLELSDIVYLQAAAGKTGASGRFAGETLEPIAERIAQIRRHRPDVIVAAGIGIRSPADVRVLSQLDLDMLVVGTALLERVGAEGDELNHFASALRDATQRERSTTSATSHSASEAPASLA